MGEVNLSNRKKCFGLYQVVDQLAKANSIHLY